MLVNNPSNFDCLEIGLASPDRIRFWSYGEIEKPETINYRTFKPERKGLFCEKIFGPVKDWECSCGKYRRVRYRGIVCERCGVEVTHSKVRRERMGHIELASPVTHIWFLKGIPSYLSLLLDINIRTLEEIIYYDSYVVVSYDPSLEGTIKDHQPVMANDYLEFKEKYGNKVKLDIGALAIKKLLSTMDIKKVVKKIREELETAKGQKRLKLTKRIRVLEALQKSGNRPEWVVLDVLPVMPPDLRPMVQLEGGRFATSDLNDLYRRVVNRNNRLKRLMDIGAPEMICRNEKRMLQEAVDVLISNGKRGRSVAGSNGRPLKSLGNIIEGKQGRFRQNLLGKRVDYSARSVIVVGPKLKFYQCGLPKEMALELFKPFVIRKLVEKDISTNVKSAKRKIEKRDVEVWDILENVIKGQPVLLNRAPTLHRLGIQAFEPILVEGSAIQIHPLVCTAFNADFDGDQMAVHVPLSIESITECKLLIMSHNNILSPSSGQAIVTPTQDMVLGIYFLTIINDELKNGEGKFFRDIHEAERALDSKTINLQSLIKVKIKDKWYETSMGRIIFNNSIWKVLESNNIEDYDFINIDIGKKQLSDLVYNWFVKYGNEVTSLLVDKLKQAGFKYATLSGISIGVDDLTVPSEKPKIIEEGRKDVEKLQEQLKTGSITESQKIEQSNEVWRGVTQRVSQELEKTMGKMNNVYIMANSGARGNIDQVRQLAGMRGLMSDSQGRTVEIPIRSNFKEGLTLTEYFISAYGARKGLVDTALRTADSGYLTRRLVDVAQDVMITIEDCGATEGVYKEAIKDGKNTVVSLAKIVEGSFSLEKVVDPETKEVILNKDELITREISKKLETQSIEKLHVRNVFKCQASRGLCQRCYGMDLSSAKKINVGEAVGILAAQSIGEPGTQLTMRTFHTGGVDLRKAALIESFSPIKGKVSISKNTEITMLEDDAEKQYIVLNSGNLTVKGKDTNFDIDIQRGTRLFVNSGDTINKDDKLCEDDPTYEYIQTAKDGVVKILYRSCSLQKGEEIVAAGFAQKHGELFIYDPKNTVDVTVKHDCIDKISVGQKISADFIETEGEYSGGLVKSIGDRAGTKAKSGTFVTLIKGVSYSFIRGTRIYVNEGDKTKQGDILFKERTSTGDASKTSDIVQGLPKVEELFEARKPKDHAILAEFDGVIDVVTENENFDQIFLINESGESRDFKIEKDTRVLVYSGQEVLKGDQITEGNINPHDILLTKGVTATQEYLSKSVLKVYYSQGVQINIKHIEVIVRQMTKKIHIYDMGDSSFLLNELVDQITFNRVNKELKEENKQLAEGINILLGITRASLSTDSFVSASSFQQTASVLTKAAIEGQIDPMNGLKENVIIGKLIPAGTGLNVYHRLGFKQVVEDESEEELVADK
ncbi:DNA-directed RNA polymerase subunit beta' [Candidatus Marinamargulisbacteria bacterium SCGC AG-410-N11]|nr:DNA-directed RNA polymerase subunit beta' [Candidatus Marinamargulisbacteria bacterium SCGC AG-410-N11]